MRTRVILETSVSKEIFPRDLCCQALALKCCKFIRPYAMWNHRAFRLVLLPARDAASFVTSRRSVPSTHDVVSHVFQCFDAAFVLSVSLSL